MTKVAASKERVKLICIGPAEQTQNRSSFSMSLNTRLGSAALQPLREVHISKGDTIEENHCLIQ